MPRVLFPVADPYRDATLAAVSAPLLSHANVYLLRVVDGTGADPKAKMPTVPTAPPALAALHPQLRADVAPNADGDGMSGSLKLG